MAIKLLVLLCMVGLSGCARKYTLKELDYQRAVWYEIGLTEGRAEYFQRDKTVDEIVDHVFPGAIQRVRP